jgi:hypothetical protein
MAPILDPLFALDDLLTAIGQDQRFFVNEISDWMTKATLCIPTFSSTSQLNNNHNGTLKCFN